MRLRFKFVGIYTLIFSSVISVVAVSLATQARLQRISDEMLRGNRLLEQSRRVRQITKDVMIGAFAPETYGNLKDVLYFEPYSQALRSWKDESDHFAGLFTAFMDDPILQDLVRRGILRDESETAAIMSRKAFTQLDGLQKRVAAIRDAGLLGEGLYIRIQGSSDPDLIALFDQARQTSYYLANSFESFLNYFIESLSREADKVRRNLVRSFILLGVVTAVLATLITLVFSSRMVRRLRTLGEALHRVSLGDFSTPLSFDSHDEFQDLAFNFNRYTNALKSNLGAMVSLARRVAETALQAEKIRPLDDEGGSGDGMDRVLAAIAEGALHNAEVETAALVVPGEREPRITHRAGKAEQLAPDLLQAVSALHDGGAACVVSDGRTGGKGVLAGPLGVSRGSYGVLMLIARERNFNDLDLIRFENYLEFAGLLADNAATYTELVAERSAEYQALQSQVRPHFLFNVLGGFAALNRMADRDTLERSILALKELLRYTVDHGSETTVREELAFLSRYCELQKMRFRDRLDWRIDADPAILERRIPKLLLQPLIENAVIHGIEPSGDPGLVSVEAGVAASGDALRIVVADDGVGFDPAATPRGVGLQNVERRIALAYPAAAGHGGGTWSLRSQPGGGCRIELVLPGEP